MHRALSSRWLNDALNIAERPARFELPLFLCPSAKSTLLHPRPRAFSSPSPSSSHARIHTRGLPWTTRRRCLHTQAETPATPTPTPTPSPTPTTPALEPESDALPRAPARKLPAQCTGCGALSQALNPGKPGYYGLTRKSVQRYLGVQSASPRSRHEDKIYADALKHLNQDELAKHGVDLESLAMSMPPTDAYSQQYQKPPLCDRCHYLLNNNTGDSIYHPDIDSIRDTLMESPYKNNHVYHIVDAADFPMSLLPRITELLDIMPLRSKNRRSQKEKYYHGQKTELSFVVTRADLLAPTKEQVDRLFPYLQAVLRDALGRSGREVRLGNMFAVSAKRSWWTKELKETIWNRGGAGWMVGKVNVGKSQLFEAVFPKGRMDWTPSSHQITVDMYPRPTDEKSETMTEAAPNAQDTREPDETEEANPFKDQEFDPYALLPPAPEETQYPEMPLVSDLPGTTASPIRVPFGNGRGELIDLPGLERTGLERHVKKEHRQALIMKSRVTPEQITLKPGQSLLLGGFIRITPREPAPVMLTYAFTPMGLEPHETRTDKAIEIQKQESEVNVENISVPGTGDKIQLAGSFPLKWDVTRHRTGPLTRKSDVGLSVDRLPYRVLSTELLIEGVGWVEIVAQVRTRHLFNEGPRQDGGEEKQEEPEKENEISSWEKFEAAMEDPKKKSRNELQKGSPSWGEQKSVAGGPETQQSEGEPNWPVVDVYSPEGKYISCRPPMNSWNMNKPLVTNKMRKSRPRRSMKGMKKLEKTRRREREAAASF